MSAGQHTSIVQEMVRQGMGGGDIDAALRAYAPDFVYHNPVLAEMPDVPPGPEVVRLLVRSTRAAFPDLAYTVESVVAEEDRVALLYSWTGTHTGAIGGMPPIGRAVSATGAIFCRLENGKIVEQWDIDDRLAIMQQLGVMPTGTPAQS